MRPDRDPAEPGGPWEELRSIDPPAEARARIWANLERELPVPAPGLARQHRWLLAAGAAAGMAATLLWLVRPTRPEPPNREPVPLAVTGAGPHAPVEVVLAGQVRGEGGALHPGQRLERAERVEVLAGGELGIRIGDASVEARGPARLTVGGGVVKLEQGRVAVRGPLLVEGPGCRANLSGQGEVRIEGTVLRATAFAGSVEVQPEGPACVVDRTVWDPGTGAAEGAPAAPAPPAKSARASEETGPAVPAARRPPGRPAPVASPALPPSPARILVQDELRSVPPEAALPSRIVVATEDRREATGSGTLSAEVAGFRAAERWKRVDDARALAGFEALRRRFPAGALRQETDHALIETLVRLGRRAEARQAARAFVERHPRSSQRPQLEALAGEGP